MENIKLVTDDLTPALDDTNRKQLVGNFKIIEEKLNNEKEITDYIKMEDYNKNMESVAKLFQQFNVPVIWDGKNLIIEEE